MAKIIIDIWNEEISDEKALEYVLMVVREGKKSETKLGKCYCFGINFGSGAGVSARLLKSGTNKFCVYKC